MNERLFEHLKPMLGTVAAWTGTITAWQQHVEWFLKVGASTGAIVVSILTVRSLLRKEKKAPE
jgi:hypothetical protein